MTEWLDSSDNANCFKQTYVQGFVDISGGSIITRGPNDGIVIGGDSSLNGTVYLGDSMFVRSDGLVVPGDASNGATAKPDVLGNADNGATPIYIPGTANNNAEVFMSYESWTSRYEISKNNVRYGQSMAIFYSSTQDVYFAAIGAPGWSSVGYVEVYKSTDGITGWSSFGTVSPNSASTLHYIGWSLSFAENPTHGTILAVGVPVSGSGGDPGYVNIYSINKNNGNHTKLSTIYGEGEYMWDSQSGSSVSLLNDASYGLVIAVGANRNDAATSAANPGADRQIGHVRVWQYKTIAEQDWTNYNTTGREYSYTIPLVQIGGDTSPQSGKYYWVKLGGDINGEAFGDYSGSSVSLVSSATHGLVVAIGAPYNDGSDTLNTSTSSPIGRGHVRVYQYDATKTTEETNQSNTDFGPVGWRRLGADIDGELTNDDSGMSVALVDNNMHGLTVAIGAPYNDAKGNNSGHVRVYQYRTITDANWTNYNIADTSYNGISPYNNPIVIGASGDTNPDPNKKYWVQLGVDIDGEAAGDESGISVSLINVANRLTLAIGARYNDGTNALNTSTSDTIGHVRVYEYKSITDASWNDYNTTNTSYTGTSPNNKPILISGGDTSWTSGKKYWVQLGADIENSDNTGASVSLATTNTGLVIGCGGFLTSNSNRFGRMRIYTNTSTISYADVIDGYYDISDGYYNVETTAALYVNGDTDISGGLTVSGDVSFNAGNLFVAGDLSLNGNLFINSFAPNSIGADAIDSTVDIEFANKLSVSTSDISFNATTLQVATNFNSDNTPVNLATNLTVPANIAIVDGSNGTVYGSYLTLTNKDATAYYNVGKSASGIFNIVDQASAGVYLASGGTSFTGTSDARLKTHVVPLESATDKIMALNPCTYQWKSEVDDTNTNTNTKTITNTKTHVGFIAQEVEKVMPELVHSIDHPAGPDYKGVNTTDLIPYLVRMIQEQTATMNALESRLDALKQSRLARK